MHELAFRTSRNGPVCNELQPQTIPPARLNLFSQSLILDARDRKGGELDQPSTPRFRPEGGVQGDSTVFI